MIIFDRLLSLFYPRKCPFCRKLIDEKKHICHSCNEKLPYLYDRPPRCFGNVDECFSCLDYTGTVRESIHRYKFGAAAAYAEIYGDFLTKCIDENGITCDIITWVPLSRRRYRERGYDQAKLLAAHVAERRSMPCRRLLIKVRNTRAQSGISGETGRKKNVSGAYMACDYISVKGKHVLLVDDVVTTGSTLSECAGVLKKAGAVHVTALTVASAGK